MNELYQALEKGDYTRPGVTRTRDGVNFTVAEKGSEPVKLVLYRKGTATVAEEIPLGEKIMGNVYSIHLKGFDPEAFEYNYRVGTKISVDPYAEKIVGRICFGEWDQEKDEHHIRGGFDFAPYDWEGDCSPKISYEDGVMYQLHVRGFTKNPLSRVKHKGTFRGIGEKIPYFKELGINQLLLMPVYDFDERILDRERGPYLAVESGEGPKLNYWGYGKARYFAPKSTFAAEDAVTELRDLVKALHREGIEVILEMCFEEDMDERTMIRCLEHWLVKYHVDGFSIVGNHAVSVLAARDPLFSGTKILAPSFDIDRIYPKRERPAFLNLAEFNDGFLKDARCLLKGDENQVGGFCCRSTKRNPKCGTVNYITNHDGFTLMDLVSYEERHNEANGEENQDGPACNFSWNCGVEGPSRKKKVVKLRLGQMKNAFLLLLLSQGTPMILAGDEFGNSQGGNNNPYCQDNEVSWVDWAALKRNQELFAFVKEAIAFRKMNRILYQEKAPSGTSACSLGYPAVSHHGRQAWYGCFDNTARHFGTLYCAKDKKEDIYMYVGCNFHWKEQELALPKLPIGMVWDVVLDTLGEEERKVEWKEQKSFMVPPRSILVLMGRKQNNGISSDQAF